MTKTFSEQSTQDQPPDDSAGPECESAPEKTSEASADSQPAPSSPTGTPPETGHAQPSPQPVSWLMTDRDQRFMLLLVVVFLTVLSVRWYSLSRPPQPLPWQRGPEYQQLFRVDVNRSTWVEWIQLEGIGQGLAHRIIAYRRLHGPFATIDDIQQVPGIGPATLNRIRPWLTISHE